MLKRLRELYDRLYIGTETFVKACQDIRALREQAGGYDKNPRVDREYRTVIRPYWRQFRVRTPGKLWFYRYCAAHKPFSPQYVPDTLWHRRIIPHFNNLIFAKAWQDKCMQNLLLPGMRRPVTVVKNIAGVFYDDELNMLTREEAAARCRGSRGRILVKPSIASGGGTNIRFYDGGSLSEADAADIFARYGRDFLVQEKVTQHPDLARLNPSSLNTIRVITFLYEGQVHLISTILRVGGTDAEVDNISHGGYQCTIQPDGRLERYGYTHKDGVCEYLEAYPNGIRFQDVTVPSFDRVVRTVTAQAAKMAHFRIIGWDMGVAPDGEPVLIEFNVVPGLNQETDGPVFGELTDRVFAEVFGRR